MPADRGTGTPRPALRVLDGGREPAAAGPANAGLPAPVPGRIPVVGGVGLAAHQVFAAPGAGEGEWFAALALPDDRVALAVGTLARPGPDARPTSDAARARPLRAALADCLRAGGTLAETVDRLDATAARTPGLPGATAAVAVLDTATGHVELACCGHLPAVLGGPGERAHRPSDAATGGPLGVGAGPPRLGTATLPAGGLLMLHAGGVAAGAAPIDWQGALMGAVDELWAPADAPGALDELADRLIEWTGGRAPVPGLTLLLATRSRRPHDDLRLDVPAVATELAGLRTALTGWLERLGAGAWARTAVPLVVSELASNAVEHAYPADRPGRVRVEALLAGRDGLLVTVADDGRWAPPRPRPGYGLALARDLSDDMRVDPTDAGTRVCARFALSRPAVAHSSGGRTRPHPAVAAELEVTEPAGGPSVVAVRGRVDRPVLAELRSALLRASRGGTRPVVLDLTAATAVAAAGVRLLYELDRSAEPPIRVRAPASSVAHDVLSLAGLDRLLDHPG